VDWQSNWPGSIDVGQEEPLGKASFREMASFSRPILHDRQGIGPTDVASFVLQRLCAAAV